MEVPTRYEAKQILLRKGIIDSRIAYDPDVVIDAFLAGMRVATDEVNQRVLDSIMGKR